MIRNLHSIRFVVPVLVVMALFTDVVLAGRPIEVYPHHVEVFTTTESPVIGEAHINIPAVLGEMEYHVYELDGIQRVEAELSQGLTADPAQSRQVVLKRLQQLHGDYRGQMQRTAISLAKAMQYGMDRYPAIVFDSQAVVYGVTDVETALAHYQKWRQEGAR